MRTNLILAWLGGLVLFAAAFLLFNAELLIQSVLYRAAASDHASAVSAFLSMAVQALLLLLLLIFLPRKWLGILLMLVAVSAIINVTYSGILGEVLDPSKIAWMLAEARQSSNAIGQFGAEFALAAGKVLAGIILLCLSRQLLRRTILPTLQNLSMAPTLRFFVMAGLTAMFLLSHIPWFGPVSSERNLYVFGTALLNAKPPPDRGPVIVEADPSRQIRKIVWLVDESISHDAFDRLIKPDIRDHQAIDFGPATSLGNCSTPSNIALRSGVNVLKVNAKTDLRATPSIWQYARKAGYQTVLLDGQVSGPPQNMMLPPERGLIDQYKSMADGLHTDRKMADVINAKLKAPDKEFVVAVLRGVHFQYTDHYPDGISDKSKPPIYQYEKAVRFSKKDVLERVLDGVDRQNVAIIYTSDHGQNVKPGVVPHCSANPVRQEFEIPLFAFLPESRRPLFAAMTDGPRSASQIFPTSIVWMGYSADYAEKTYDHRLMQPSKRQVWFGRTVVPVNPGDQIDVGTIASYQASNPD
ncbi:MAG: sulfatase-like hydrolase/transferase [Parasphingorhabdus sp.]|uniref:sulfatase-like hydrolase/transferase n=1 Tax=Parasphingorhabdus sp. TaxID=2709688 RepID=UPI003264F4B6